MTSSLSKLLMALGFAAFATATAWWLSFFYDVLGDEFQRARECFYFTTQTCLDKKAADDFFSDVPIYDPRLMWLGVGMFALGVILRAARSLRGA